MIQTRYTNRLAPLRAALYTLLALAAVTSASAEDIWRLTDANGEVVAAVDEYGNFVYAGTLSTEVGTVTLDQGKDYWTIRNSSSEVVFAIDQGSGDV